MMQYILEDAYGDVEHNLQGLALDRFFGLYRGSAPLIDYCTAFRVRYDTAQEKANLEMNAVCRTHLFLTHAGLQPKLVDDILLKVDGDRSQFNTIFGHVQRSGKQYQGTNDESLGHMLLVDFDDDDEEGRSNIEYYTIFDYASAGALLKFDGWSPSPQT